MAAASATEQAWEAVIGLETHVQLGTESKIFTAASTSFGDDPNTHIDPVVYGLPGTLPVLNQKVLEYAVKAAMALNLNIAEHKFDRKQYFYPDLPKNYQISQYDQPIAEEGWIEVDGRKRKDTYLKTIGIERLHMEEDAGKLVHAGGDRLADHPFLVDYNRAGVALAEIVSKPDLRTGREAAEYASEIRRIMRYLGVSDGNMQEGSLRCDVNISVRRGPDAPFGTKVEIKNMNSPPSRRPASTRSSAGEGDRSRRDDRSGDPPLGRGQAAHQEHAQQGGGQRLPLLPGSRPRPD